MIAAGPTGVWVALLTPGGDGVVSVTAVPGPGGGVPALAAGYVVSRDETLAVMTCSTNASTSTSTLWLAPNVCLPGAAFVAVNATLPGPCSGLGLGDGNRCVRPGVRCRPSLQRLPRSGVTALGSL